MRPKYTFNVCVEVCCSVCIYGMLTWEEARRPVSKGTSAVMNKKHTAFYQASPLSSVSMPSLPTVIVSQLGQTLGRTPLSHSVCCRLPNHKTKMLGCDHGKAQLTYCWRLVFLQTCYVSKRVTLLSLLEEERGIC